MKKLLTIALILLGVTAKAQTLFEVNLKVFENEIGGIDTIRYISARVSEGFVSEAANSGLGFQIYFHRPDGTVVRSRYFTQTSYVTNLTDAGMPLVQAQEQAAYVWVTTIPTLLGTNLTAKKAAIVTLLDTYNYTLKEP